MVILLAALLQSAPTLPTDQFGAAMACADAMAARIVRAGDPHPALDVSAQIYYYSSVAARENLDGRTLDKRSHELLQSTSARAGAIPVDDIPVILSACETRFPPVSRTKVKLPVDRMDRGLLCVTANSFMAGMASGRDKGTGGDETTRFRATSKRYASRIDMALFKARGFSVDTLLDTQLAASLDIGTMFAVAQTCAALP